ncbi:N-acetylmuramidase family protein [Pseudomonas gingeri]|uniref:N-acetylmuramidase family protein n=1 Tax=Pseudomonas gingeri TaxID=117681 RepID=A0A7Y8C0S3_9PSED|nr:N-acetylmuramidase family protein [Pseudomonas gingeri]NWA26141.1 N-acetylmuramidase family protein [Pseudomonas gingeri]NWB95208.1 N-acetylmuramidase family protein [Pseudomonas gingeri]NWD67656.1 N-acetylmuramidase family protein [Pseudomonas gingeri]
MKSLQGLPCLISASVGAPGKARNLPADVQCIQYLFNLIIPKLGFPLPENGKCDGQLLQCISQYQFRYLKYAHPDGVIDPTGRTFNSLIEEAIKVPVKPHPTLRLPTFLNVFGNANSDMVQATVNHYLDRMRAMIEAERRNRQMVLQATCDGGMSLTDSDFQNAATQLGGGVSVNIIKAFATVESGGRSGFGPAKLPVIAFEGHLFRKYTKRKYDQTHPLLSYPYVKKAGPQWQANNKDQTKAWDTMATAFGLDQEAALMSASWGMFQIMGFNFSACGYKTVFEFTAALKINAGNQLKAFLGFCSASPALVKAMKNKDYVGMAMNYNGKDYGDYDSRIKKAYEALEGKK